jgi:hypothetical protein
MQRFSKSDYKVTIKFIRRGTGEKKEKHFLFPTQEMGAKTRKRLSAIFLPPGLQIRRFWEYAQIWLCPAGEGTCVWPVVFSAPLGS